MAKDKPKHAQTEKTEFAIQRIYVKDLSFEAPNVPEVFSFEWNPKIEFDLKIENQKLADDDYEVMIQVTVTVKLQEKVAYLVEVKQAGIFTIKGLGKDDLHAMQGSFCPNILFPYARETLSDLINRGSFPPLYLAPINFDALYQQELARQAKN